MSKTTYKKFYAHANMSEDECFLYSYYQNRGYGEFYLPNDMCILDKRKSDFFPRPSGYPPSYYHRRISYLHIPDAALPALNKMCKIANVDVKDVMFIGITYTGRNFNTLNCYAINKSYDPKHHVDVVKSLNMRAWDSYCPPAKNMTDLMRNSASGTLHNVGCMFRWQIQADTSNCGMWIMKNIYHKSTRTNNMLCHKMDKDKFAPDSFEYKHANIYKKMCMDIISKSDSDQLKDRVCSFNILWGYTVLEFLTLLYHHKTQYSDNFGKGTQYNTSQFHCYPTMFYYTAASNQDLFDLFKIISKEKHFPINWELIHEWKNVNSGHANNTWALDLKKPSPFHTQSEIETERIDEAWLITQY